MRPSPTGQVASPAGSPTYEGVTSHVGGSQEAGSRDVRAKALKANDGCECGIGDGEIPVGRIVSCHAPKGTRARKGPIPPVIEIISSSQRESPP